MSDKWFDMHKELSSFISCDGNDKSYCKIGYVFLSNNFVYEIDKIIIRKIPGTQSFKQGNFIYIYISLIIFFFYFSFNTNIHTQGL